MHELSIAQSIIEGATEELGLHPGRSVAVVHLQVGRLSGVAKEVLLFSYELACADTPLEGSVLEVEEIAATVFCRKCDREQYLVSIPHLACPVCLTPTNEVVRGRELLITYLELTDEYAAATG